MPLPSARRIEPSALASPLTARMLRFDVRAEGAGCVTAWYAALAMERTRCPRGRARPSILFAMARRRLAAVPDVARSSLCGILVSDAAAPDEALYDLVIDRAALAAGVVTAAKDRATERRNEPRALAVPAMGLLIRRESEPVGCVLAPRLRASARTMLPTGVVAAPIWRESARRIEPDAFAMPETIFPTDRTSDPSGKAEP